MKLISFILEIDGKNVREIPFLDSLNIITSKKKVNEAGNSVGKSTLGRVLDYLFDGSIAPIYIDEEFGTPKQEIEQLFTNSKVYASLEYLGLDGKYTVIKRRLSTDKAKQTYILNGVEVKNKEYNAHIMVSIFNVFSSKPTIRKLAPKFLRTNQYRMTKTVKFDNTRNVSESDINTVFLYLFNFNDTEILSKIHALKTTTARYKRNLKAFNSVINQEKIVGSLSKLKNEIGKLEKSLSLTEKGGDKLEIVKNINKIDDKQDELSNEIFTLDFKIKNIIKTNEILKEKEQSILLNELRSVYDYASIKIESVLNDYEQALIFHDILLNTKKDFVSKDLEELKRRHEASVTKFELLEDQKHTLFEELKSKKKIEELSETVKQIGTLNKELAKLTAIIEKRDDLESDLEREENGLSELSSHLKNELMNVTKFEENFISNFRMYTKKFYNVEYNFSLHLNNEKGECQPAVDEIQSNNEGGLKRLEVVTFDLSYIKTVSENKVSRPNFVLHDSIDEIDIQYIRKIFDVSIQLSGQHIVSMLSDKLSQEDYAKYQKYIILELSKDNKFFKI